MKEFKTTGACNPDKNYMVDISSRIMQIKAMVDEGLYFTINRARQYGKTTTLAALASILKDEYIVLSLDFQSMDNDSFKNGAVFTQAFAQLFIDEHEFNDVNIPEKYLNSLKELTEKDADKVRMADIFRIFKRWFSESDKPLVLIIDEIDSATNNQVFLDFLALLRESYIARDTKGTSAFKSVILAGVTDIKNLKRKIRQDEDRKFNSPWNIAAAFNLDMSLSAEGIAGMLNEYEKDHATGMDTVRIADEISRYTSGYPFLVSRICQILDKEISGGRFDEPSKVWTVAGVSEAVRILLMEKNTLFDSLMGKIYDNESLRDMLQRILFGGERIPYNPDVIPSMDGEMYGFIKNNDGALAIANTVFETRLYNYFLGMSDTEKTPISAKGASERETFIENGHLNMEKLLSRYATVFDDIYGDDTEQETII